MDALKVIIVGSGLAGSLLANGLLNQSSTPTDIAVFERDDQATNRKGYQIRLGSHALTGFRACLTKSQFDALLSRFGRSGGTISSAPVMFSPQFKLLLDLRKFPAYTKSAPINRALLRDILQEPLRNTGVLHYHKKFTRYEILSSGGESRVRAYFSDGSTEEGDILIAADGSGSAINRQLGANNIVQMAKRQGFLGKSDLPLSVLRTLPKALIECGSISCLADEMNMFASVYLPDKVSHSNQSEHAQMDKVYDYDEEEASLMVGVGWPTDPAYPNINDVKDKRAYMMSKIKHWHPGYSRIIEVVDEKDIYVVQGRASEPLSRNWRQAAHKANPNNEEAGHPRVWMVGDSVHPMLPSRGMGANQALHDCADALTPLLELAQAKQKGTADDERVSRAVMAYEDKMIPRSFGWVKMSGGTSQSIKEFRGLRGWLTLFFMARMLDLTGLVMGLAKLCGWKAKDDAPELS